MSTRWLVALTTVLLLCAMQLQAAPRTEIVDLGYSMADSLIPALQPMLRDDERVSAYGNQLIIRAEPDRIDEIRALINELDRQPARLRISVASSGEVVGNQQGYQVDGRFGGRDAEVVLGNPHGGNQARIIQRSTRGSSDGVRQITANEGYPVLIQSGQSVPLTSTSTDIYGRVTQQTQYQNVTQGFYATVRLNGDHATITLSANNDRVNPSDRRVIDVQQTDTVVSGRVGEWITVGGLSDIQSSNDRDIGRRTTTRSQDQGSIRLKVERLN